MVQNLLVGTRPISFSFSTASIMNIDEKKKVLILADSVDRTYKDTIDDGNADTADIKIANTFPTLRQVYLPYVDENGDNLVLTDGTDTFDIIELLKDDVQNSRGISYEVSGDTVSLSDSKIVVAKTVFAQLPKQG